MVHRMCTYTSYTCSVLVRSLKHLPGSGEAKVLGFIMLCERSVFKAGQGTWQVASVVSTGCCYVFGIFLVVGF